MAVRMIFVGYELFLARKTHFKTFDLKEMRLSLMMHVAENLIWVACFQGVLTWFFNFSFEHRIVEPQMPPWLLFAYAFILVDFAYYVGHVYSHYFRLGWATHIVHHTPERINFSVGFRLGISDTLSLMWIWFAAVCWLGVPPLLMATCFALNMLYQFTSHSEVIPKLGWIEYIFNTPSSHRVHHACNPEYRNRNFGGVFIVFDRLFGTYKEEDEAIAIRYGLGRPLPKGFWNLALMGWKEWAHDLRKSRPRSEIHPQDLP